MIHNDIAIKVHNLHKSFDVPEDKITSIKQAFLNIGRRNSKKRQVVLDGIDFEVNKGDFFGIVGRNGSGKSTLLKIIAGVYSPDSGAVEVRGNLTPFIELGVGFNPELSGRDNVYLNAALLGYSRKQVDDMYEEIVGFAELEDHMDKKLKNYSSGMQVRLAFSIAIKAKNDVLIFDEVLAVGDEAFQKKCLNVFNEYKKQKQTLILVTHNMEVVRKYCNRALLLDDGKILMQGNTVEVSDLYTSLNNAKLYGESHALNDKLGESFRLELVNDKGKSARKFRVGEKMGIKLSWKADKAVDSMMIDIFKSTGEHITGFKSKGEGVKIAGLDNITSIVSLNLAPGGYHLKASMRDKQDKDLKVLYDIVFDIDSDWSYVKGIDWAGLVKIEHVWSKQDD